MLQRLRPRADDPPRPHHAGVALSREDKREDDVKQLKEVIKLLIEQLGLYKQVAAHWKHEYDEIVDAAKRQKPLEDDRDYQ
jgi:CRISPR/Cas system CSM-associated protein Csm4 (group 5 of RAMP superfamily)